MDLKSDVVIVGGGLAGSLAALRLAVAKPDLHVVLVEANDRLGGTRTWNFRESDLDNPGSIEWLRPMISKTWEGSSLQFPRMQRTLGGRWHSIRSEDLHKYVMEKMGDRVLLKAKGVRISESHVELENDHILAARCILDARGSVDPLPEGVYGYRKTLSLDVKLEGPHGLAEPVLIDANCPQLDGLRFFQLFPWDEKRLMVAETFYSDTPELNRERIVRSIRSFIERRGWKMVDQGREEMLATPIPMTSNYLTKSQGGDPLPIGMRGGYFHATTGRSLPDSVRIAEFIAQIDDLTTQSARDRLMKFRRSWMTRQRFYRLLNRWLFYASEPSLRYTVLQHFYQQPTEVLERFESGRTSWSDRMRMLTAKPPVPFDRAFRSFTDRAIHSWAGSRKVPGSKSLT